MMVSSMPKTLVIGGANLDMTGSCSARLIPGDSNPGIVRSSPGGVGRNIAENLARLGLKCSMITAVGQDLGQQMIKKSCEDVGINTDHFIEFGTLATGTYLAINNQLGALLAAIADMSIIDELTPNVLQTKLDFLKQHEQLIIEANLSESSIEWLASNKNGLPLFVDAVSATKAPRLRNILGKIDVLKLNRDEASAILNKQIDDVMLAEALHNEGVKTVLLSQGPQGAIVYNKDGATHRAAIKGANASDTGAGDALFAGYIASTNFLASTSEQLEFAIACATFTLNSRITVNPELSIDTIRTQFLKHIPKKSWSV
jgi:pseudouridine kinase